MSATRVVYVIATAAPPVCDLSRLLTLLRDRGWSPWPVLTPTAATWVDLDELAEAAGSPVRVEPRLPGEEDPLPQADAVLAAPLSFNTINKWAAGISDTLALGLLNELLGADVPIVGAPCVKPPLRQHPAYTASIKLLDHCDVTFLDPDEIIVRHTGGLVTLDWEAIVENLDTRMKPGRTQ